MGDEIFQSPLKFMRRKNFRGPGQAPEESRNYVWSGHFFKDSISVFERCSIGLVGIKYQACKSLQSAYLLPDPES